MTINSKRREAERRLIEAVRNWRSCQATGLFQLPFSKLVIEAYDDYAAMELELPDSAPVNAVAPLTAQQAATWMAGGRAKSAAGRIVRFMWQYRSEGWTVDELELGLNGVHQTISPRVNELRKAGWLYTEGTRTTRSGRDAEIYFLTDRAKEMLRAAAN